MVNVSKGHRRQLEGTIFGFFFFVPLGFELRASCLLGAALEPLHQPEGTLNRQIWGNVNNKVNMILLN
jgi:hypothetical protein